MVLLLNACGTVLTVVGWQRAVTLLVTGEAVIHEADPDRQIHSQHLVVPLPRAIRLVTWVYVRYLEDHRPGMASKKGVLERDRHTCAYCGKHGNTIDHLQPQSKGGRNTWENMVACCAPCNQRKADRTPEQAGMRLRWQPWCPDTTGGTQRKVWASLQSA